LRAKRDATSKRIGKEIREREETKRPPVKNRRRKIAIFRHAPRQYAQGQVKMKKRVALITNDTQAHGAVAGHLVNSTEFDLLGSYTYAESGKLLLDSCRADLALVTISPPAVQGLECALVLRRAQPDIALLFLFDRVDFATFLRVFQAGAQCCLMWPTTPDTLLEYMRLAIEGRKTYSREWDSVLISHLTRVNLLPHENISLTPSEEAVMARLVAGLREKDIARETDKPTATVHSTIQRIYKKLGVHNQRDAVRAYLGLP